MATDGGGMRAIGGGRSWRRTALAGGIALGAALGSATGAVPAAHAAAASDWATTDHAAVRLVSAVETVGADATLRLGLHFRLKDGWKIYWRTPGDAGLPPRVDFAGSENIAATRIDWPAPKRFSIFGFETAGYAGEVVLPLEATLARAGAPVAAQVAVDYLLCDEICIPYDAKLALALPSGDGGPSPHAHLIARFGAQVPGDGRASGLTVEAIEAAPAGDAAAIRVTLAAAEPLNAPDVFVEGPAELAYAKPRLLAGPDRRRAVLEVPVDGTARLPGGLVGRTLTVTAVDGGRSVEYAAVVRPAAPSQGLAAILAVALLGGLILNLMPCVLPVLSMKLAGALGHGGGARGAVRREFVAAAAGIVVAFLVLAGALIGLKALGYAVGWGIQFQQPWFLAAMAMVVTLFACSLWGWWSMPVPGFAAGAEAAPRRGLGGSFLTGMFATLLATPCSAPFVGTAVGFALARGAAEIAAIFGALGLGLALPYLAVAAYPAAVTWLPRPGPWLVWLRRVLGLALAGTAAWLLWVLAAAADPETAAAVGALAVAAAGLLALRRHWEGAARRTAGIAVAALALAALALPPALGTLGQQGPRGAPPAPAGFWQPFSEARLLEEIKAGRTVLVDVTADWCITCQVNKQAVLMRGEVLRRLTSDVVALQADWTQPDPAIAAYLRRFGRYGIPFDAVYGPAAPAGIALPELLTETAVLEAFARASPPATAAADRPGQPLTR